MNSKLEVLSALRGPICVAALVAFYAAVQIINPTRAETANSDAAKYNSVFSEHKAICEKASGSKIDQVLKYGKEICVDIAHDIAKENTK
ncbi:hypothetical protein [Escherichia phage vB_EcoS_SCS31]|uniref:Uncharacterized protein n=1 Tax=Escherichia phage vB_EcoS_SCS31 TaxID=2932865 RepID=A0A9E6ZZF8_9CAUD|nr:hypothetical protein [Escherichia phage vB_EcoS_SCS31]